jgi:DNA-binding MarR family transcriptional regulator
MRSAAARGSDAGPANPSTGVGMSRPSDATGALGQALTRLVRAVNRAGDLLQHEGDRADVASFPLLVALVEAGTMRASDLAAAVMSDRSTVSRQVAQLVAAGHVARGPDPTDRRAHRLAVTEAGARVLDARRRERDAHVARLTRDWSEEERATLARLVDRLSRDLMRELRQRGQEHFEEGP